MKGEKEQKRWDKLKINSKIVAWYDYYIIIISVNTSVKIEIIT